MAAGYGIKPLSSELGRKLTDDGGRQTPGLQNRLRGAVEASWVGSIPIHPRQILGLAGHEFETDEKGNSATWGEHV